MSRKQSTREEDIVALRKALSNTEAQVLGPADEGYLTTIKRWSRAAEKSAAISVVPITAEEVSIAVKYASEHNLDLAVKGGGHSTAGASSTNGGVLIDLSGMRDVKVDPEKKLLHVQGGALWLDVDAAAWEHGLATVGGTVADTGVGGLTLGGGYGHLTGKHGLVIDNVVEITVVLASGEITTASHDKNQDLFWALLGAGQNFGVTVEFVLKAYPQGDVYTGALIYPPTGENIAKIVAASNDLYEMKETPSGPKAKAAGRCATLVAVGKPPPAGGQTMILVLIAFFGDESEGNEVLKTFLDIGPVMNSLSMQPYPEVNKSALADSLGNRASMKGAAFVLPLRPAFVSDIVTKFDTFVASNPDATGSIIAFELYDSAKLNSLETGSFANRGYHLNGLVMPTWSDKANDAVCRQWARDMSNTFKTELEEHGEQTGEGVDGGVGRRGHKGAVMLYGNYDQYDERSKDIFGENFERLQKLKGRYDPGNVFDKLFPVTPA